MPSSDSSGSRRPRIGAVVVGAALIGLGLFAWLLARVGLDVLESDARALVGILPAVLLLTGLKYPLQAVGWRLALKPEHRPPVVAAVGATIAGDALGYLTWAGPFTGEPMKAALARDRTPVAEGIAAGAVERGMYNVTGTMVVTGAWLLVAGRTERRVTLAVLVAAAALVWGVRVVRRRRRRSHPTAEATPASSHGTGWRAFKRALRELWRERRGTIGLLVPLGFAQHALLVVEAYLMLRALDAQPSWTTALVFEGVTKVVNTVGTIVPGRLGIAEGGTALLGAALGYQSAHGLGLALMRRVRALLWAGVGLVFLVGREYAVRRANPAARRMV